MCKILTLCIIFLPCSIFGSEKCYSINKPTLEIVKEIKAKFGEKSDSSSIHIPPEAIKVLKLADLSFDFYARPQHGYYKFTISLENRIRKLNDFEKTLEVWSQPDKTVLRSSVNIDFGRQHRIPLRWIDNIKECIIEQINQTILEFEKQKILELAQ